MNASFLTNILPLEINKIQKINKLKVKQLKQKFNFI